MRHLAIIGGGFSGTATLIQLLRATDALPTTIHWCDESAKWARGVAYGTTDSQHLLNVRADRMGAFPDAVDDFYVWLKQKYPNRFSGADYVPRMMYGDYLASRLHEALTSLPPHWSLNHINEYIVSCASSDSGFALTAQSGVTFHAEKIVLACGNEACSAPNFIRATDRNHPALTLNPWHASTRSLLHQKPTSTPRHAVLIGSGLTSVDVALSLLHRHPNLRVTMLSRHGLLPTAHSDYVEDSTQPPAPALPAKLPATVLEMWRLLKQHARAHTGDWRTVIDSVRSATPAWWHALPEAEKRRAMRHAISYWNRWRHRMSDTIAAQLHAHQAQGRLKVLAARIQLAWHDDSCWQIQTAHTMLQADEIILCLGFAGKLNHTRNLLLQSMLSQHIIQPGPLGIGIAHDENNRIMALGTLMIGEWFESVAVPELRVQAQKAAQFLIAH